VQSFNNETSAIMPMVSYDVPVTNNANVYLVGYSFVEEDGKPSWVIKIQLTTGVEAGNSSLR